MFRQPMGRRRPSTTATIVGPSAASGSVFSRKWRPVQSLTNFLSTAVMSKPTAQRQAQKGEFAEAIGRSRGGKTSKIHAVADDRGRPVAFALTPGNVADITMAAPLHGAVARPKRLLADKAYDADSLHKWLKQRKIKAVIPSTASRRQPYPLDSRSINVETSSNACSASSRTGDASQPDMTAMRKTIFPASLSQPS